MTLNKKILMQRVIGFLHFRSVVKGFLLWLIRLGVPRVVPTIERSIKHDTNAFTQGLAHLNGVLYESTGTQKNSSVRCIDLTNGELLRLLPVPGDFCEGIALLNNRLFQLSWKNGIARIYELPSIKQKATVNYSGEGWGLTAHQGQLIKSDGSSVLQFVDEGFNIRKKVRVTSNIIPVWNINDIESGIDNIFANVYGSTEILEISPDTGRVLRIIDCKKLAIAAPKKNSGAVMNGIAFNADKGTLFVTGKYWKYIFEIRIPPSDK